MIERYRLEQVVEGVHEVAQHWSHRGIQEFGRQVVDAQFQRAQALVDEIGSSIESVD